VQYPRYNFGMPALPAFTTATLIDAIDANTLRARTLASGLSAEQFNWQPAPGVWSVGQNLAHLNILDGSLSLDALRASIASGRARNLTAPGPFRCGPLAAKFVASQAPPVTRKFNAPKAFHAPPDLAPDSVLAEYLRISADFRSLVQSAEGLDLARIRTILPALPPLLRSLVKMSLVARLALVVTHDSRHLWQIEQLRLQPSFPR